MWMLLVLLGCLGLGAALRRHWSKADVVLKWTRFWVIFVALPAVILKEIPGLVLSRDAWLALVGGWWVFLGAVVFFGAVGRGLGWSRATVASLILTAGLGNTSFVGLPAIRLLVGESGVGPAILFDQLGSFLSLAIGGAMVVAWGRGEGVVWGTAIRKFVLFPPTLALLLAVGLRGVELGSFLPQVLGWVSQTLSPAALFAVGLAAVMPRLGHAKQLGAGLAWKLVLAPLGVLGIAAGMGSDPGWTQVAVLQAGMAPMVTGGILAASADLEPELASQMVMIGLFVSGLSLPVWNLMF